MLSNVPCPPSYEEREQSRLDVAIPQLREAAAVAARRLAVMRRAAALLEAKAPLDDPERELAQAREVAAKFDSSGALPAWTGKPPAFKNGWPDEEDLSRQQSEESWLNGLIVDAELAACVLGCAIARWLAVRESGDVEVIQALEFHREHRLAERAEVVKKLEGKLGWPELAAHQREALERELEKVRSIEERKLFTLRKTIF
ncbi:MAG: hypothetical protein U0228_06145 [Myxococcaceae bacterium]